MTETKKRRPRAAPAAAERTVTEPPATGTVMNLRCWRCDRALMEVASPGTRVTCYRCGARTLVPEGKEEK